MAVLPLDIETRFHNKRLIYLIKDELSTDKLYTTVFIDDHNEIWFQRTTEFLPFQQISSSIIHELYIHLLLEDEIATIIKDLDMRTAVETYLQVAYGNFFLEQELDESW